MHGSTGVVGLDHTVVYSASLRSCIPVTRHISSGIDPASHVYSQSSSVKGTDMGCEPCYHESLFGTITLSHHFEYSLTFRVQFRQVTPELRHAVTPEEVSRWLGASRLKRLFTKNPSRTKLAQQLLLYHADKVRMEM